MIPEQKDLLLKDLCARLPYGVKCEVIKRSIDGEMLFIRNGSGALGLTVDNVKELVTNNLYKIKPYLFPLSSMTEEQKEEYVELQQRVIYNGKGLVNLDVMKYIGWCYKHHIDINNLIPIGLAIDATNLNIY